MPLTAAFNGFDWFLLGILALSTLFAFQKGFIRVLFSLGGLVAGIIVASWNYLAVAGNLSRWIHSFEIAEVVAFLLILTLVSTIFGILAKALRKTISAVGLGIVDRLLGAAFGLLRGCLLGVAVMMALAAFLPDTPLLKQSQLAPYFLSGAHAVSFVVPRRFQQQVADGAGKLLDITPELLRPHTLKQPVD